MNANKLKKDFLWYSIGAAIPMILSFIKTPIFTRYYSPTDFGNFTLISTTSNYINLAAFSWLTSCVWRYYIHEKNEKELNKFYTNIALLFFAGFIITSAAMLCWIYLEHDIAIRKLITANYINLVTSAITSIYLTVIRLDGKSLIFNLYAIGTSVFSFAILLVMAFVFKSSIDSMLTSSNIVNGLFIVYVLYKLLKNYRIKRKYISKGLIKEFIAYGFAATFFNISLSLLSSGDRYVIKIFYPTDRVGIYNQIYNLSQISIGTLTGIFFSITNPYTFKLFEEDIHDNNEFYKYVLMYIICILPFTIYFSIYSKEIADLLLGEKFRVGYRMMPYVMVTSFIYGLSSMHETRLKFKNKLKAISVNLITASMLNMALNFMLIPVVGYESAAITTLISYIFLYIMNFSRDAENFNVISKVLNGRLKFIIPVFSILSVQIILHFLIQNLVSHYTIGSAMAEGIIFSSVFYIYIYIGYMAFEKQKNLSKMLAESINESIKKLLLSKAAIRINTHIPLLRWIYYRYMTSGTMAPITFFNLFYQKILGINRNAPWPVHYTSTVTDAENITIGIGCAPGLYPNCYIQGAGKINIGDYTLIEPGVGILSVNPKLYDYRSQLDKRGVNIGRYCWIGINSVILPGSNLGDHTIVIAGSVVTGNFEEGYCVIGGAPARKIRDLNRDIVVEYRNKYEFYGYSPGRCDDINESPSSNQDSSPLQSGH